MIINLCLSINLSKWIRRPISKPYCLQLLSVWAQDEYIDTLRQRDDEAERDHWT